MNYYEHHIGDYDKATAHLTACEDGIYCRLIRRYYDTEQPISSDIKAVQRLVRARSRDEKEAVETILEEFFYIGNDGMWHHNRCDQEVAKYHDKQSKARASAQARWKRSDSDAHSEGSANASPNAMRTHSEGNAHQTPDTIHQVNPLPSSLRSEGPSPEPTEKVGKATTFKVWLQQTKAKGETAITGYRPVFEYCQGVGIPEDWLQLAWFEFRDRYLEDEKASRKRYIDWRRVFLRSVKERWAELWYFRDGKAAGLTTKGQQAQIANAERLAA